MRTALRLQLTLLTAFASAILFIYGLATFSAKDLFFLHGSNISFASFIDHFREAHKPLVEMNLTALYGSNGEFAVLHPLLEMRRNELRAVCAQPQIIDRGSKNLPRVLRCNGQSLPDILDYSHAASRKSDLLDGILKDPEKAEDFLRTPPFIDELGASYSYRLFQLGPPVFQSPDWLEHHLSFFKISELKEILPQTRSRTEFAVLASLQEAEIGNLVQGAPVVLARNYLLIKNQTDFAFSPLSYWVYEINQVQASVKDSSYDLVPYSAGALCLEHVGNGCWTYNSKQVMMFLYRNSLYALILIGLIFFSSIGIYLKQAFQRQREYQKHKFALQVLSHEFRTPVSTMLLTLEGLTADPSRFSTEDQDAILRLSAEAFRLQRIIEVSKNYLQLENKKIKFQQIEVASINEWVSDFIDELGLKVRCKLLERDQSLKMDPFWMKFVLSNLIQNAFAHGAEPVTLKLLQDGDRISITVQDEGVCDFSSLRAMTEAFVKSPRSHGMGLGLNISNFIVQQWGGVLHFSSAPTSFTLSLEP